MTNINNIEIPAGTWTADSTHSEVGFTVRHAGISKVRGSFANYNIETTIGDNLSDLKITAELNSDSIETGVTDRDGHLKSADFFDSENFPKLTFTSNEVVETSGALRLNGVMTIKGVSKNVALDVEFNGVAVDAYGNTRAGLEATTVISRKDFGLTWNTVLEAGNLLVSDKVTINLDLSFILTK